MASGNNIIYWDASIFIAWLTNESGHTPEELSGLTQVVDDFDKGHSIIVTSMITKTELLPSKIGAEASKHLALFWKRRQFQPMEITEAIVDLSNHIRDFYAAKSEKPPSTPDSIHLATAIIVKVDVFQTFDGGGKKRGLLDLNSNVAGYNLKITKPFIAQRELL